MAAKPLDQRISPDNDPAVIKQNLLLKALGTFSGVSHVLSKDDSKPCKTISNEFTTFEKAINALNTNDLTKFKKQSKKTPSRI